jgi:hypothetical protein
MRRRCVSSVVVILLAVVAAACGGSSATKAAPPAPSLSPAAQLRAGMASLGSSPSLGLKLRLAEDAAQLEALGAPGNVASLLAGGSLVVELESADGTTPLASGPKAVDLELDLEAGGTSLVELRSVHDVLYARADVQRLLALAGKGPSALGPVEAKIPPGLPFVSDFLHGSWVSLDLGQLRTLLQSTGLVPSTTASPAAVAALVHGLEAAFAKDVSVARIGASPTLGTELSVTANLRTLTGDLVSTLEGSLPALGGVPQVRSGLANAASRVPNRDVTLDAFVQGTTLRAFQLDLAQFAPPGKLKPGQHLVVELDVSHAPVTIAAPPGAVAINLPQLFRKLASGLGGMGA